MQFIFLTYRPNPDIPRGDLFLLLNGALRSNEDEWQRRFVREPDRQRMSGHMQRARCEAFDSDDAKLPVGDGGMYYAERRCGFGGIVLFREPRHTDADVAAARVWVGENLGSVRPVEVFTAENVFDQRCVKT